MTTVTLTANPSGSPAPYIDVLLGSIDSGVATVTVWRTVKGRQWKVRGLVNVPATGTVEARDFEAPFDVEADYRVQQFDSSGNFVSWSPTASATLNSSGRSMVWIHNPIDPSTALQLYLVSGAATPVVRPLNVETMQVQQRSLAVAIFGTRGGVSQVPLDVYTFSDDDADVLDSMFGDYDDTSTIPILCIRVPASVRRVPPTFFALVASPSQAPFVQDGQEITQWSLTADEIAPPPEAIIVSLLGYDDFTAFYADYAAFTAAYVDYQAATLDYSIAGTA